MKNTEKMHNYERNTLSDLNRMLDDEMAKPQELWDYARIEEITRACAVILNDAEQENEVIQLGYEQLRTITQKPRIRMTSRLKKAAMLASAAVLAVAMGVPVVTAFRPKNYSPMVEMKDGCVALVPPPHEAVVIPTSTNDLYGIKAACAEYGITNVLAPTYLPAGFEMRDVQHTLFEGYLNKVSFRFSDADKVICITYNLFADENKYSSTPCDDYNLTETTIHDYPAIISQEDEQYVAITRNYANLETVIWIENVDYDLCEEIIVSLE